jgi:aminopeptidase-like protein
MSSVSAEPVSVHPRDAELNSHGEAMIGLLRRLWPICRSITGDGVRQTLGILREWLPQLEVHEVPTGTRCFDWTVPPEWNIRDAQLTGPDGATIVSLRENNLHVVGYSAPVDRVLTLDELQPHLHSIPGEPEAIPYVTSYYRETWGFCMAHAVRERLQPGSYHALIDSSLESGSMTYGELVLPGADSREVLLSTYICHPSMANNELSGPCVTARLATWLAASARRFTYRIVFVPETIGAICYISRNLEHLRAKTHAGFVLTCVGDERAWSYMPSRAGDTVSDRVARHVLEHVAPGYTRYSYLERGSDERQYCSPGVDLPVCSVMRSKYATYPEYHTSLDDMRLVTPHGLQQSFEAYRLMIRTLEGSCTPHYRVLCEPRMSDRGLRPTLSRPGSADSGRVAMNLLAYSDGSRTLLEIASTIGVPAWELRSVADQLAVLELLAIEE